LGGNRGGSFAVQRNLALTMLLGGLWHGASWNFVVWGGLHGLALAMLRPWERGMGARLPKNLLRQTLSSALTLWFVCLCWILFRAQDFSSAWTVIESFTLFRSHGEQSISTLWLWWFAFLYLAHWLASWLRQGKSIELIPSWAFAFAYGVVAAIAVAFMRVDHPPFIYFQF